jgi:hypothetical protein
LNLVREKSPDKVAIEYPIFNDLWSEGMYGLFLFSCEALFESESDVVFFAPSQLQAFVHRYLKRPIGWRIGKEDMIEAAKEDTGGVGRWSSDEADAYIAAFFGGRFWEFQGGLVESCVTESDLTIYQNKVFSEIRRPTRGKQAGEVLKKGIIHREDERFFLWSKYDEE